MREIKFRAWDKANNLMSLVGDLHWFAYDPAEIDITVFADEQDWENEPDLILMQYTGLRDCKGKEIYEGDVFRQRGMNNELINGVVIFDEGYHGFRVKEGEYIYHWLKFAGEVIGNIYQNPELLERLK